MLAILCITMYCLYCLYYLYIIAVAIDSAAGRVPHKFNPHSLWPVICTATDFLARVLFMVTSLSAEISEDFY